MANWFISSLSLSYPSSKVSSLIFDVIFDVIGVVILVVVVVVSDDGVSSPVMMSLMDEK